MKTIESLKKFLYTCPFIVHQFKQKLSKLKFKNGDGSYNERWQGLRTAQNKMPNMYLGKYRINI